MRFSLSQRSVLPSVIVLALVVTGLVLFVPNTHDKTLAPAIEVPPAQTVSDLPGGVAVGSDAGSKEETLLEPSEVAAGEVRTAVQPIPSVPLPISGHVQWPDGRPAAGCTVDCAYMLPLGKGKTLSQRSFQCEPSGAFRTVEFGDGAVVVLTARSRPGGDDDPSSAPWVAHAEGVQPGTKDLALVLRPGSSLRGSVLDDEGRIQSRTRVAASPFYPVWGMQTRIGVVAGTFDETTGSFELTGLHAGEWIVTAERPGYFKPSITVTLPGDDAPVHLVLRRFALLSGLLVDGSDRPVADARVSVGVQKKGAIESTYSFSGFGLDGGARSEPNGHFVLPSVTPGHVILTARSEGGALVGTLQLDLQPGESRSDLKVVLLPARSTLPK